MRSSQILDESDGEQAARAGQLKRRNRLLVGVGLLCFIVGVPLVSLNDGTALSVIGLSLEAVAATCVIGFIYLLAGDQHEPDSDGEFAGDEDWPAGDHGELAGPTARAGTGGDGKNEEH